MDRIQRRVDGVVDRSTEAFNAALKLAPKPFGAKKVSEDDDHEDYILTTALAPDPKAAFKRRIEERVAEGYSTEQALTWGVDWVRHHEKRIAERMAKENGFEPPAS